MIQSTSIQAVRDRIDIVEVVGHFLSLKRRGGNFIANCPFHNEKTPSFNVNPSRGIYKCFGCGKAGDAVSFIQEYEKFSFVEAIKWLAQFYNITLEETAQTEEQKQHIQIEESLRIVFEFAAQYFQDNLWNTDNGKIIGHGYFRERGFNDDIIKKFNLGYAHDAWQDFYNVAIKNGFSNEILVKSGIVAHKNEKYYDAYRGRVIFPIQSNTGKFIGFGARILAKNERAPKYINTSENEVYNKSKILYALYQSRNAIAKKDQCILVEGYTDVISLHQNGVENVVSSSGTALTVDQLKLLKHLTKNLIILFDGDAAGVKATLRGMEMALNQSYNVKVVNLPENEDPDSYVQKHGDKALYDYIATNQLDVIDFHIKLGKDAATNDPVAKSKLVNELANTIAQIDKAEDFVLQQEFIKKAAAQLNIEEKGLITLVNKIVTAKDKETYRSNQRALAQQQEQEEQQAIALQEAAMHDQMEGSLTTNKTTPTADTEVKEEWKAIEVLLKYGNRPFGTTGSVAQQFFNNFEVNDFSDSQAQAFLQEYQIQLNKGLSDEAIARAFIQHSEQAIQIKAIELLIEKEQPNPKWETQFGIKLPKTDEIYINEVTSAFAYLELKIIQELIKVNLEDLKIPNLTNENLITLMKTHQELKQHERSLLNIVVKK